MTSHTDTIRRMAEENAMAALRLREERDALLAEIEEWRILAARQLEEFTVTTHKYRAENQRLRDALERIVNTSGNPMAKVPSQVAREALAGDAE